MTAENNRLKERASEIAKYVLVAGVVAFLSFLFPNNARFKYDFELGQTWRYNDLVAPFDFAIRKDADEIEAERTAILEDFSPYYQINPAIGQDRIAFFEKEFNNKLQEKDPLQYIDVEANSEKYLNFGKGFLEETFRKGILKIAPQHSDKPEEFVINIVSGRNTRQQTLQNISNTEDIEELIQNMLPSSSLRDPDFLFYPLRKSLKANLLYSDTLTKLFKDDLLSSVSVSRGKVSKGDLIIPREGIINEGNYRKLKSFQAVYEEEISKSKSALTVFLGYLLLTSLSIIVFLLYLKNYLPEIFNKFNKFAFILMWFVIYGWLVFAIEKTEIISAWVIPFCIVPIVIKTFFSDRLAFFTHVVVVLIAGFLSSEGYEFTLLQILAGMIAILTDANARNWNNFFGSIAFIFLTYALGWLGLSLIRTGDIFAFDFSFLGNLFANVFLTLLAFPLIPLLERIFGFTSALSLTELSDMNRPLLKRMGLEAPGTLQHSIQVGNLCEAVASEIGADELLVKTAALYHDIGKIPNARYFIENQSSHNPHDDLTEKESARIIINHVTEGLAMAKKAGLPRIISKFIASHHGTTRVEYFYRNYLKNNPEEEVNPADFTYPGPIPVSKEETILMFADSIEAASKSLKNPTGQDIDQLVDKIITSKINQGQFAESEITFEELEKGKAVMKKLLRSMNHVRIEYPEEEK